MWQLAPVSFIGFVKHEVLLFSQQLEMKEGFYQDGGSWPHTRGNASLHSGHPNIILTSSFCETSSFLHYPQLHNPLLM